MHVCESAQRVMTYPWAAEGAGGEARGGSANRPRPVARTHTRGQRQWRDQRVGLLHVSVNTGGGEKLEKKKKKKVRCCTQLEKHYSVTLPSY